MNRYYDEEEYNIPGSNPCLYSNIKVLREEARLTIEDLAEKMEVSSEVIKLWESNKAVPSYYEIEKLLHRKYFESLHTLLFLQRKY